MKIILLKDVPRVGVKGSIHDLAQAYAMNSFVSKGLAKIATVQDEKSLKLKEEKKKEDKAKEQDKYIEVFSSLEKSTRDKPIEIKKKIDSKGHFYAKVSAAELVEAIFKLIKVSINERQIVNDLLDMQSLGLHEVVLSVNNRKYKILVKIVAE